MSSGREGRRSPPHRACLNCRRKKVRCPGEHPACSSCIRLNQLCAYKQPRGRASKSASEKRIAYLEEKLDLILNDTSLRQHHGSPQLQGTNSITLSPKTSPRKDSTNKFAEHGDPLNDTTPSASNPGTTGLQYSLSDIVTAIDLYFKCYHRQPIWLFEREEIENQQNLPPQLIYTILALTSRFHKKYEQSKIYGSNARSLIMDTIVQGAVELSSIEALCLLSFWYFRDNAAQLGHFHLGLALQLHQSAILDHGDSYTSEDPMIERKRRLYWSLQILEQSYGRLNSLPNTATQLLRPHLSSTDNQAEPVENPAPKPPSLPDDNPGRLVPGGPGIWSITAHMGWVLSKARAYVSECARNLLKEPWRYDSKYAMILSDLIEIENWIPIYHRYDSVKFWERSAEDLRVNRAYWTPWLRSQFMYHMTHIVINHPFLYVVASQHNQKMSVPNTFWRRSSELALLHATWIVRWIDMVGDKQIQLYDPCFGHAAAIASTIHLYYCCAADPRLKHKSNVDLEKCRKFLKTFVSTSYGCRDLDEGLDEMARIAFAPQEDTGEDGGIPKFRLSIPLIWEILQFRSPHKRDNKANNGLLHSSLLPITSPTDLNEGSIVEIVVATSPNITVDTTDGGQTAPATSLRHTGAAISNGQDGEILCEGLAAPADSLMLDTSWMWADHMPAMDNVNPEQPDSEVGVGNLEVSSWWNFGNL